MEPTDDWELLLPLFAWTEQQAYEKLQPMVLFGDSVSERAGETGKPKAVGEARLFESSYRRSWPQARLFAPDDASWLEALKLGGYTPRRLSGPMAPRGVLFLYLDRRLAETVHGG